QLGRVLNWFLFYLEDQALNEINSCSKVMEISIAVGHLYCAIVFYKKKGVRIFFWTFLTNISLLLPVLLQSFKSTIK
ncbi:hypothetical protein, partial [Enterococcus faecium]